MEIELNFEDVFVEAQLMSEQIGKKVNNWNHHRIADEDEDQLRFWFCDGLTMVNVLLDRLIKGKVVTNTTNNKAKMNLLVNNDSATLIGDSVRHLIANHMLVRWLKIVAPDVALVWAEEEKNKEQALLRLAYYREMPY